LRSTNYIGNYASVSFIINTPRKKLTWRTFINKTQTLENNVILVELIYILFLSLTFMVKLKLK